MTGANEASTVVARLLLPDDANPSGNVHGGTMLSMMEEAGMIVATRFLAADPAVPRHGVAALVRFENMSFHEPVYVGEVASVSARVIFTSKHSFLVRVVVTAEDLFRAKVRITNTGELWYVPLTPSSSNHDVKTLNVHSRHFNVALAPQLPVPTNAEALQDYNKAKQSYIARKHRGSFVAEASSALPCQANDACLCPSCRKHYKPPSNGVSPAETEQRLCQMVLPGDCSPFSGVAFGGFVMKLMDSAAGCSAVRHCRSNVVTVAISAINFMSMVRLGDICSIESRVTFCSSKSMAIEVTASVTSTRQAIEYQERVVARGRFTFASLDPEGKTMPVPKLRLETDEDMERAYQGQLRYEAAKKRREEGSSPTA